MAANDAIDAVHKLTASYENYESLTCGSITLEV